MIKHSKTLIKPMFAMFLIAYTFIQAQDKQFAMKGVTELSGSLSYSSFTSVSNGETGDAMSIFVLAPQIGYFVTDGFELGLGTGIALLPGFSVISPEDGESTNLFQFFFAPSYNFQTQGGKLFPFIEAQLGYTSTSSGDNSASGFSYGGRVGLKVIAVEHFLISITGQYLVITLNEVGAEERNGINYLMVGVGMSGYF